MKVALVHDWLTGMRGGEKCLESLCRLYPGAHIHTLFQVPGAVSETIDRHPVVCSYLQTLPHLRRYYRTLLPLFPSAIEEFDLSPFDLVISSSHCVAKGVRTRPGTLHICYCHTPMRYVYDLREAYFSGNFSRRAVDPLLSRLKRWDKRKRTPGGPVHREFTTHPGPDKTILRPRSRCGLPACRDGPFQHIGSPWRILPDRFPPWFRTNVLIWRWMPSIAWDSPS